MHKENSIRIDRVVRLFARTAKEEPRTWATAPSDTERFFVALRALVSFFFWKNVPIPDTPAAIWSLSASFAFFATTATDCFTRFDRRFGCLATCFTIALSGLAVRWHEYLARDEKKNYLRKERGGGRRDWREEGGKEGRRSAQR